MIQTFDSSVIRLTSLPGKRYKVTFKYFDRLGHTHYTKQLFEKVLPDLHRFELAHLYFILKANKTGI